MDTFIQKKGFQRHCSLKANHLQPFQFNEHADTNYMKGFIAIFKCTKVKVDVELYNYYLRNGLLDQTHTMGESKATCYQSCLILLHRCTVSTREMGTLSDEKQAQMVTCVF